MRKFLVLMTVPMMVMGWVQGAAEAEPEDNRGRGGVIAAPQSAVGKELEAIIHKSDLRNFESRMNCFESIHSFLRSPDDVFYKSAVYIKALQTPVRIDLSGEKSLIKQYGWEKIFQYCGNICLRFEKPQQMKDFSKKLKADTPLMGLGIGTYVDDKIANILIKILETNKTIRKLSFTCLINTQGMEMIADYIRNDKTIEELNFKYSTISMVEIAALAGALRENNHIKRLGFRDDSYEKRVNQCTKVIKKLAREPWPQKKGAIQNIFQKAQDTLDTSSESPLKDPLNLEVFMQNLESQIEQELEGKVDFKFSPLVLYKKLERERLENERNDKRDKQGNAYALLRATALEKGIEIF